MRGGRGKLQLGSQIAIAARSPSGARDRPPPRIRISRPRRGLAPREARDDGVRIKAHNVDAVRGAPPRGRRVGSRSAAGRPRAGGGNWRFAGGERAGRRADRAAFASPRSPPSGKRIATSVRSRGRPPGPPRTPRRARPDLAVARRKHDAPRRVEDDQPLHRAATSLAERSVRPMQPKRSSSSSRGAHTPSTVAAIVSAARPPRSGFRPGGDARAGAGFREESRMPPRGNAWPSREPPSPRAGPGPTLGPPRGCGPPAAPAGVQERAISPRAISPRATAFAPPPPARRPRRGPPPPPAPAGDPPRALRRGAARARRRRAPPSAAAEAAGARRRPTARIAALRSPGRRSKMRSARSVCSEETLGERLEPVGPQAHVAEVEAPQKGVAADGLQKAAPAPPAGPAVLPQPDAHEAVAREPVGLLALLAAVAGLLALGAEGQEPAASASVVAEARGLAAGRRDPRAGGSPRPCSAVRGGSGPRRCAPPRAGRRGPPPRRRPSSLCTRPRARRAPCCARAAGGAACPRAARPHDGLALARLEPHSSTASRPRAGAAARPAAARRMTSFATPSRRTARGGGARRCVARRRARRRARRCPAPRGGPRLAEAPRRSGGRRRGRGRGPVRRAGLRAPHAPPPRQQPLAPPPPGAPPAPPPRAPTSARRSEIRGSTRGAGA